MRKYSHYPRGLQHRPAAIEDASLAHPEATGAAALGRSDAHSGEVPLAYVTVSPDAAVSSEELRTWAAWPVPEPGAAPKSVTILDIPPVTAIGKPNDLPLRVEAARDALREGPASVEGSTKVDAAIHDGTEAALVTANVDAKAANTPGVGSLHHRTPHREPR